MDVSQFDSYLVGMETSLNGEYEKQSGGYWEHTTNTMFAYVNEAGSYWFFSDILDKPGTFIELPYTGQDCPCDETALWEGFWDEPLKLRSIYKPRENNEFMFSSVTLGPIVIPSTTTTTEAAPTIRKSVVR